MELYAFDLDDNIVTTDACVRCATGRRIPTRAFASMRHKVRLGRNAFAEFQKVRTCALQPAPCFPQFIGALTGGHPVAIITARSNTPTELRSLLARALSETGSGAITQSLRHVRIYCCNSPGFIKRFPAESLEERKYAALQDFIHKFPAAKSVGFSDDDAANLRGAAKLFRLLRRTTHPKTKFRLYEPVVRTRVKKRKV